MSNWCQVSGEWQDSEDRTLLVRENKVPLLLRDPVNLLHGHLDRALYSSGIY